MGSIVAQRLGCELDQILCTSASVSQLHQATGHRCPAQWLRHLRRTPLDPQIGQRLGDVVQQRGKEHDVCPDIALLIDLLNGGPGRQQMTVTPGHGCQGHLQRVGQQPAHVRVVVGFRGGHELYELCVVSNCGKQISLPHVGGKTRLAPQTFQCVVSAQAGQQVIGV